MAEFDRPLSIAMLALGGQGGGVLTGWLVELAEANGFLAQSTYVAGVAQRSGATVYSVEMFPKHRAEELGKSPIFTPYPIPGDVDLVIAGEMAETGRAILKGFVTPNATTLIASSHRVYSIDEKSAADDGVKDQSVVWDVASEAAKSFVCFDMQALANDTGSVISAVLFGAIAGSGALPFSREAFENTIRETGRAVEANLAGFAAGFGSATKEQAPKATPAPEQAVPEGAAGKALAERIATELPPQVHGIALHGALRCLDYQDADYANEYVRIVKGAVTRDSAENDYALSVEVARQLALQMCYEDIARVADLKTRATRFERIRQQAVADDEQPVRIVEYFHPRFEEICDILPKGLGERLHNSNAMRRALRPFFSSGRNITTSNIGGYLLLHWLAKLKLSRRGSYRFARQREFIEDWLDRVNQAADTRYDDALSLARAVESVRGYGDTYDRGLDRYREAQ